MKIMKGLKKLLLISSFLVFISTLLINISFGKEKEGKIAIAESLESVKLPLPRKDSDVSVEKTLLNRRSIRNFKDEPLTLVQISQLLWSAQGITDKERGLRTSPSAGALYPLEIYLLAGNVNNLPAGVYKYNIHEHALVRVTSGDKRKDLCNASLGQSSIKNAPAVIVISAIYEKTTGKYKERGIRYVHMEVGSASENVYLQAETLNLGTVFIGAFIDNEVKKVMNMQANENPLCIMPIGKK